MEKIQTIEDYEVELLTDHTNWGVHNVNERLCGHAKFRQRWVSTMMLRKRRRRQIKNQMDKFVFDESDKHNKLERVSKARLQEKITRGDKYRAFQLLLEEEDEVIEWFEYVITILNNMSYEMQTFIKSTIHNESDIMP